MLRRELFEDLQEKYRSDQKAGKCLFFEDGQEFIVTGDNFFRMMNGKFCS